MSTLLIMQTCDTMRCNEQCCSIKNMKHLGIHKSDFCCSESFYEMHEVFRKATMDIHNQIYPPIRPIPSTTPPIIINTTTTAQDTNQDTYGSNDKYNNMALGWSHFGIASAITAFMLLVMVFILLGYIVRRKQNKQYRDRHSGNIIVHHSAGTDRLTINDLPQIYQNINNNNISIPSTPPSITEQQKEIINKKALEANLLHQNITQSNSGPSTSALPAYEDLFLTENEVINHSVA